MIYIPSDVKNLINLLDLNLSRTKITDIKPLFNLSSLSKLTLDEDLYHQTMEKLSNIFFNCQITF